VRRLAAIAAGVVLAASVVASVASAGTVYTIAPGDSVAAALTRLRAGDTLVLRGGTYAEAVNVTMPKGTAAAPIVVRAAAGERPVITGLFWIGDPTYTAFDGINVTWGAASGGSGNHMVKLKGGTHWTFTRAEVWGAQSYANILVTNGATAPTTWSITSSCIHDAWTGHGSNQDHNIYVGDIAASSGGLIAGNTLFNALGGRNIKLGPGSGSGGPANVTISGNTLFNSGQGISLSYGTKGTSIVDNVIARTTTGDLIDPNNLAGAGNTAADNVGWDSHTGKVIGDSSVRDLGGNVLVAPRFGSLACPALPGPTPVPSPTPTPTPTPTPAITPSPTPRPTPTATPVPSSCGAPA
jgi:parallel beta-helix repeat protein